MQGDYSLLPVEVQAEIDGMLADELKRGGFDLPSIVIGHGMQVFAFPGKEDPIRKFRGIFLGEHRFNAFWDKRGQSGGIEEKQPPMCAAQDGVTGSRWAEHMNWTDPATNVVQVDALVYGKCAACLWNRFGTSQNGGRGKACANKAHLLVWPVGVDAILPYLLTISGSSLVGPKPPEFPLGLSKAAAELRAVMSVQKVPPIGMVAEFTLEKMESGSQVWSVLHAACVGTVRTGEMSLEDMRRCQEFVRLYMPRLHEAPLDGDEQVAESVYTPTANDDSYPPIENAPIFQRAEVVRKPKVAESRLPDVPGNFEGLKF
jgi:hypothetical protein